MGGSESRGSGAGDWRSSELIEGRSGDRVDVPGTGWAIGARTGDSREVDVGETILEPGNPLSILELETGAEMGSDAAARSKACAKTPRLFEGPPRYISASARFMCAFLPPLSSSPLASISICLLVRRALTSPNSRSSSSSKSILSTEAWLVPLPGTVFDLDRNDGPACELNEAKTLPLPRFPAAFGAEG